MPGSFLTPRRLQRLVLLGGGHSHLTVLRSIGMTPLEGVQVTLVAKDIHTPYSGMLPGYISGHYTFDDCHIDLQGLATFADARLIHARATGIDTATNRILFNDRPAIPYDALSIDVGITPDLGQVPGVAEYVTPVKPINEFIDRIDNLIRHVTTSSEVKNIAVVGGGAGGVEVAFAINHRINSQSGPTSIGRDSGVTITLVSRGEILSSYPARARAIFVRLASERGIRVLERSAVSRVRAGALILADGSNVPFDECLWCTSAAPAAWLKDVDLPKAQHGFIAIDEYLRSAGGPCNVFACGDVATSIPDPRPKAGVFAVRQGPPLVENLRRFLQGRPLKAFHPQSAFLSLITSGEKHAVASNFGIVVASNWLWTVKDRIDRAFMDRFSRDLPKMTTDPAGRAPKIIQQGGEDALAAWAASRMRCGGCAAKVSSTILHRVLARLRPPSNPSIIAGVSAGDDAAIVKSPPPGHVTVQTVDFFRSFTPDPYVFGRIAANHALSDCYAMGATPTCALAIAVVPFAVDDVMEDDLFQMMAGASSVLEAAGCALGGGHSCEGQELSLGFTVTGHADERALMTKGALRDGDAIVLTKAIGTGVLLKGCTTQQTKGRLASAALEAMQVSNAAAARILVEHGVKACTDVTGFGLIGHLAEMAQASGVEVDLDVGTVPALDGASELVEEGLRSSLHDQNAKASVVIANASEAVKSPKFPLLVDPQTAGGLLCGVKAHDALALLKSLHSNGYTDATIIGQAKTRPADEHGSQCIRCVFSS